ncbi:clathrin-adaptor gamma chain [Babesia caballi]|uniref:AP-1 complex subunit gamma n=1 Tax=Babesia caballi TaxID=5871 RepID=A0AAV4LX45_BABCB|nr:clathrin-adaptor gamma chain [Babesia caballi]
MTGSVKDMIRAIRSCKTAGEERAVIARECAEIRSSLNGNSSSDRRKNIAKLLLIQLMGHSTNFGQVECIKLIASSKYADKRMGYLALSLLLNEDAEVLTLAINSIKMDLNGNNVCAAEAALGVLANIGSQEMFRELQYDLERLMKSPVVNLRKKAVVCAARMLRMLGQASLIPGADAMEMATNHVHLIPAMLGDSNHGMVAAGLTLLSVLMDYFPKCCNFASIYELLVKTMNCLCSATSGGIGIMFGGGRDYDINGVDDPFLKVKMLALIRRVYAKCRDQVPGNQQLYDIVHKIVKCATLSNNATNALLYECVRTIYSEMRDPKFNELGKSVMQKFIATSDNNIKYVALGILNNLEDVTLTVGDSTWTIIVQSLRQPDISIRRRALEVALKLMTRETLKPLMQHLFDFLLAASSDLKRESITKIAAALERHAESEYYRLELLVKIFSISGNCVPDAILHSFIAAVGVAAQQTQVRVTTKLYYVLGNNLGQDALVRSTLWCLGEYAHLLPALSEVDVTPSSTITAPPMAEASAGAPKAEFDNLIGMFDSAPAAAEATAQQGALLNGAGDAGTASKVVATVETVAKHIFACSSSSSNACLNGEYLLTCVAKLACRLPQEAARLLRVVKKFKKHPNLELQQRACEMDILFEHNALHVVLAGEGDQLGMPMFMPEAEAAPMTMEQLFVQTEPREQPAGQPLGQPAGQLAYGEDLLGLVEAPAPKATSAEKLATLDFMSFDYSAGDGKTKNSKDEFGEFDPF